MNNPLVTIAVPCYNQENYLGAAIDSMISQDYRPIQIIISDDASTDRTPEIARQLKEKYPDLIALQLHEKNLGVSGNCDSIYPLIKGGYVTWFAGDDLFLPGKITKQLAVFQANPKAVLCYHNVEVFDDSGKTLYLFNDPALFPKTPSGSLTADLIKERCFIPGLSVMIDFDKTKTVKHRLNIGICSDWLYFIELSQCGDAIYLDECLARYRRHGTNLTNKIITTAEDEIYDYLLRHYPAYIDSIRIGQSRLWGIGAAKYALKNQLPMALVYLRKLRQLYRDHPFLILETIGALGKQVMLRLALFMKTGKITR